MDGDCEAFQIVYTRWLAPINSFLRRITRNEQDARDLAQDVFCTLWMQREKVDPEKDIRGLIFTIARYAASDHIRRHVVRNRFLSNIDTREESYDSTSELILAKELELLMEFVIRKMPPMRRTVYLLNLHEGLSTAKIAERLTISPKRVNDYLYEARQDMKKAIAMTLSLCLTMVV